MIKVVLDTNVLISALIRTGKPRELLLEIVRGKAQLILSRGILGEFAEVAADDKIRKYVEEDDVTKFLRIIGVIAARIRPLPLDEIIESEVLESAPIRTQPTQKSS